MATQKGKKLCTGIKSKAKNSKLQDQHYKINGTSFIIHIHQYNEERPLKIRHPQLEGHNHQISISSKMCSWRKKLQTSCMSLNS